MFTGVPLLYVSFAGRLLFRKILQFSSELRAMMLDDVHKQITEQGWRLSERMKTQSWSNKITSDVIVEKLNTFPPSPIPSKSNIILNYVTADFTISFGEMFFYFIDFFPSNKLIMWCDMFLSRLCSSTRPACVIFLETLWMWCYNYTWSNHKLSVVMICFFMW